MVGERDSTGGILMGERERGRNTEGTRERGGRRQSERDEEGREEYNITHSHVIHA